jgi:hypothetical protein
MGHPPRWHRKIILLLQSNPVVEKKLNLDNFDSQSSLRDRSCWECTPSTASWATFSRPSGLNSGKRSSHEHTKAHTSDLFFQQTPDFLKKLAVSPNPASSLEEAKLP